MADVKEDTGPPPPEPVDFDVEKANDLLEVVHNTKDLPSLMVLNQTAMAQLGKMAAEVQKEVDERKMEYDNAMADWEAQKRQKAKEEAEAIEKEKKDAA